MLWSIRMDVSATRYATRLAVTYCLLLSTVQAGDAADCEAILGQFNLAIDEGREQDAQGVGRHDRNQCGLRAVPDPHPATDGGASPERRSIADGARKAVGGF